MTEWNDTLDRISLHFLKNTKNVDQEKIRCIFQEKYLREIKTKDEVMVALLKQQKHRQQLYYTKQLSDLFQDRILFMKGVLVSYDLYGSIDIRDSHDIDIVVKEKDIRNVGEYLLNENFECSIKKENWERETDKNHLVFKKIVFSRVSVVIELHKYIFNPARFYPKVTELIWKRAIKKKMLSIEPWMMDVYDQVIYYSLHFYIHSMELENFAILGLDIGFRIQPMLDIYYTIKKYNISYDILYERVYELGVASEFYAVWKLINNIFPDVYSELFETRMKRLTTNLIYNEQNFWRERISLKEAMDHFFSKDYISWCAEFIRYDYSNMEYLNYQWKDIFSFHSEKFQFLCQGKANQGIQVRFEFDVREKYDINKAEIWIYYRFNNQENVYLCTNGYYLDKQMIRNLKKSGLNGVRISIDSTNPLIHDKVRNYCGAWWNCMAAILNTKLYSINTVISMTIGSHNITEYNLMKKMADALDCRLSTHFVMPKGKGSKFPKVDDKLATGIIDNLSGEKHCVAATETIYIDVFGNVSACSFLKPVASVNEYSLREIMDLPEMINFTKPINSAKCKMCNFNQLAECPISNICRGGCWVKGE